MANIYVDLVMIFQNRGFFYRYIATKFNWEWDLQFTYTYIYIDAKTDLTIKIVEVACSGQTCDVHLITNYN